MVACSKYFYLTNEKMDLRKYATKALAITTFVTLAIAGEAGAALDANEPVSANTIATASGTAYGGTQSAS